MFTKTSILVFYITVGKSHKLFKRTNYFVIIVVIATGVALTLVNIFQCNPIRAAFERFSGQTKVKCDDFVSLYFASGPLNVLTDLGILVLPYPLLKSMRLPRKQKIILFITFGFGVFASMDWLSFRECSNTKQLSQLPWT